MKNWFISSVANTITGLAFVLIPYIIHVDTLLGFLYCIICGVILDLNQSIQKDLNYPNNLFIKH